MPPDAHDPGHLLILTTLDVAGRQNNREHHAIAAFAREWDRLTVVYRARTPAGSRGMDGAPDEVRTDGRVTWVAVRPALHPPEGAARSLAGRAPGAARRLAGEAFDVVATLRDRLAIRALARGADAALRGARPRVAEGYGPWATLAALDLRRRGVVARVAYLDRDFEPGFVQGRLRRSLVARAEAAASAGADLTLAISPRLLARHGRPAGPRLRLSPTGIDRDRLDRPPCASPGRPDLLALGQVADWTGIEEAAQAVARLRTEGLAATLQVVGPVEAAYRPRLDAALAPLGPAGRATGEVPRGEVPGHLAVAGVGFAVARPHPLRTHAAPLKVLEYMAAGLPVLASEGSAAGDLVSATGAGLVVPCTPEGIAGGLARLAHDHDMARRMGEAGRPAAAGLTWPDILAAEARWLRDLP